MRVWVTQQAAVSTIIYYRGEKLTAFGIFFFLYSGIPNAREKLILRALAKRPTQPIIRA